MIPPSRVFFVLEPEPEPVPVPVLEPEPVPVPVPEPEPVTDRGDTEETTSERD